MFERKELRSGVVATREPIAAPTPVVRLVTATGGDRIEREVAQSRPRIGTILDDAGSEAPLQQMTDACVPTIEPLAVSRVELLHQARQWVGGGDEQQVVVVPEQA